MKVYRCDRCGNHYTQKEHTHTINIFEVVDGKKKPCNLFCISPYANNLSTDILDLCPDCMISLINWINHYIQSDYVSKPFDGGRKFGYEYVEEDFAFNKISKEIQEIPKEVKEDDNN